MSIITPDKRELKVEVYLSAIGMSDIGVESGNYSVFSANNDPQNLRPSNYYTNLNNPLDSVLSGLGITEFKFSNKLKQLPSIQNAKMSEPYTAPSASSCTFAYGGIWPADLEQGGVAFGSHPVFNLLYGPVSYEYRYFKIDIPVLTNSITGLRTPYTDTINLFSKVQNINPFVPFIYRNTNVSRPIDLRLPFFKFPFDVVFYDEFVRKKQNCLRTTYNIWQSYDINSGIAITNRVIKYEGPNIKVSGIGTQDPFLFTSIRTIRDGLNGSSLYVDSVGKGRTAKVKRIFPTSKDAIYKDSKQEILNAFSTEPNIKSFIRNTEAPFIFYPSQFRRQNKYITGNPTSSTGYSSFGFHLCADEINTMGSDNCGFYIKLKNIYMPDSDSSIILNYEDQEPDIVKYPNSVSKIEIVLKPNSLPKLTLYKNKNEKYKEFTTLNSPIFATASEFDIFVHFAGPVLLIGFDSDQSKWNSIYPDKNKNNDEHNFLFKKEKSYVSLDVNNTSFSMTYSAIMFDNYSLNPKGVDVNAVNNIWFTKKEKTFDLTSSNFIQTGDPNYVTGTESTSYDVLNPKNFILMDFKTTKEQQSSISQNSLLSSLIDQKFMSVFSNNYNTLGQKPVSVFGDWRNTKLDTNNSIDAIFNIVKIFSSENTDKYKNLNIIQDWSKLIFNGTIEGALFLGLSAKPEKKFKDVDFLKEIVNGNISNYVKGISVFCEASNSNKSLIKKTATITLSNLDSSLNGWKILELIEHNIIVLTVKAYYGTPAETDNPVFFQGAITNVSTTRSGSRSELTISCEDLSTYLLENIFFDGLVPYATLTLKDCVLATMQASGFGNYFTFASYNNNDKVDDYVRNLDLRLSPNPTTSQDIMIGTIYDRILDKLNIFLSKFVGIPSQTVKKGQATFRWEAGKGFIFDARYSPYSIDDLLFTGIDPLNDKITSTPISMEDSEDPGWHGLLSGDFTISTQLAPLSSSVDTFGFTTLDGYIAKFSDDTFLKESLSQESLNAVVNSLTTNTSSVPAGYVGFRKKIMDQLERNEIFSEEVLKFKHEQNEKIAREPFHTIRFNCYVTRPLNFHGTFIIRQFLDDVNKTDYASTDQYIYSSITYTIDKNNNLITADIQGVRQPWTIRELEIRYGESNQ